VVRTRRPNFINLLLHYAVPAAVVVVVQAAQAEVVDSPDCLWVEAVVAWTAAVVVVDEAGAAAWVVAVAWTAAAVEEGAAAWAEGLAETVVVADAKHYSD
jgi:hypothetical protein